MATEKILNTRIQLKYDTLSNWNSSTFKLKAGELAIVSLGEMKDGSTGLSSQYPVLFKVGTGNHTFAELPFASALAADVYAWAKASEVALSGKTIQFKNGDNVVKSITLNYITESEATTLINNALAAYSTTEQMNAAIKVEADRAAAAEKALGERIDAFNLPEGGFASKTEFNALKNKIEDEDGALAKANSAYELAETKVATADFNKFKGENTTAIGAAKDAAIAAAKSETEGQISALVNSGAVKTNTDAIAAINNGTTGILATAKGYTDGEIDKVEAALGKVVDGTTPVAKATDADKLGGVVAANYALKTDAQGYANTAEANAKKYADDMKNALLGEGIKDTFDTLVEIQNWIEGDGVNATELADAIAAEAKTRGEEDTKLQNQINALGITNGKVSNAATADVANSLSDTAKAEVKAVKVDNATNADVAAKASGLNDAGVTAVKAVKVDNAGHADSADSATNAAQLGGVAAANYLLKTDAPGYGDILTKTAAAAGYQPKGDYASAAQGALADSALQKADIATGSANGTISVEGSDVAVKGLGSAAYTASTAYATAAQGTKADNALQSVEVGTGLKVSAKANNKQTIEIDDSVVFVFDCGSASKYID